MKSLSVRKLLTLVTFGSLSLPLVPYPYLWFPFLSFGIDYLSLPFLTFGYVSLCLSI